MTSPALPVAITTRKPREDKEPAVNLLDAIRAADCNTPERWEQWARERLEYENGYGHERGRRW